MGIPRKHAGLQPLKDGLSDFGVLGEFLKSRVTHDELDAITSALVGLFFWTGKFERLGNDDEDYLIIPDLQVLPDPWRERQVVGLSGPIAAGKTTAAEHLRDQGFSYGRFSLVLERELRSQGRKLRRRELRRALQEFGGKVNEEYGQRWLCQKLLRSLPEDQDLVIDGLRFPEDHAYLVESFGPAFFHIHVHASEEVRSARYVRMGHSAAKFRQASGHRVEAMVRYLGRLAHRRIANEGSEAQFLGSVDARHEDAQQKPSVAA